MEGQGTFIVARNQENNRMEMALRHKGEAYRGAAGRDERGAPRFLSCTMPRPDITRQKQRSHRQTQKKRKHASSRSQFLPPKRRQQRHARRLATRLHWLGMQVILGMALLSLSVPLLAHAQASNVTLAPTILAEPTNNTDAGGNINEDTMEEEDYFHSLPRCNLTTQEMVELGPTDVVEPCVLFDIQPKRTQIIPDRSTVISLVQVTPATACRDARDGATTSVELLNALDDHQGLTIGFHNDFHVQFRLVSIIAGNADQLGATEYGVQHERVLRAALAATQARYIVGTCSFASAYDKAPALVHQTMVLAQVGPPGYYSDVATNPYIFGVHINSDDYPLPTVRALGFRAALADADASHSSSHKSVLEEQPVRVIYRTKSEFFNSTCHSAIRALQEFGFQNVETFGYDPDGDEDKDGTTNQFDEGWLRDQADKMCPPQRHSDDNTAPIISSNPAIFACVLTEQDVLLEQWKKNGCRPNSLWMTPATWGWASANPEQVPFFQGGGQWHEAMTYGDRFFDSGTAMLEYNHDKFGYQGSYDTVVRYACHSEVINSIRRTNSDATAFFLLLFFY